MIKNNVLKEKLLSLIHELDSKLSKKINIYAVGGTGMTLLNLKASTKDIDFNLESNDLKEFKKALSKVIHGYDIDIYSNGQIFTQQLPQDYKTKAILIKEKFSNIKLYSIHPVDIVVTKIGRLNERDFEDITDCIKKYKLTKKQIEKRGKQVIYAGNEDNYNYNLKDILKKVF